MPLALSDDLTAFLADFGVPVTSGAIATIGILDLPTQVIEGGMVLSTEYQLTAKASELGGLSYGDQLVVDGQNYQVRDVRTIDDGAFVEISMMKLAPTASAPGGQLRAFGLNDLSDVALVSPAANEALVYDGTQWTDGVAGGGIAAYVHTQATASSTWTINHNLGYCPAVEVFDSGSNEVDADITHPTLNQTIILFVTPISGFARLI